MIRKTSFLFVSCSVVFLLALWTTSSLALDILSNTKKKEEAKIAQIEQYMTIGRDPELARFEQAARPPSSNSGRTLTVKQDSFSCHYSSPTQSEKKFECDALVNQTIVGEKLNFNASFSVIVDLKSEWALVEIDYDGMEIYKKNMTIADLTVPICVTPAVLDKLISLCLDISGIKFDVNKDCFRAFASLDLKILFVKTINIIPPTEFGWNMAQCDASSKRY
ncbi:hypothetical protein FDP41_011794 [Naegleria fowleri]|uniref:Pherophorin domain-containing protein n=1 Tax=Naegleria fowleri TaxID=5763 RepID=A0A6A5BV25_NAEFO|nr:uncharacterized protein FDP41_011794 [Naegleria fowleri]KAF0981933.1 hypothetical protein FDP41_011794 [Naegleria fowleri]CAG4708737.1 unnamed protein product [Naegleria fowleri]